MQKNKVAYDKYLQQYTTQKKIQRPSDDPTIAVRALKYRTTISEIDQYLKNIERCYFLDGCNGNSIKGYR